MNDRDIFGAWFEGRGPDPMRSAQKGMRPVLPKRFYKSAEVIEKDGSFAVALDGRVARTPGKALLAAASRPLAEALAAEWSALKVEINPTELPMTRILNSAIDGVAKHREAVAAEIVSFASSDLICYRAAEPALLVKRQNEAWDPVLSWAAAELGAGFECAIGIVHRPQSETALGRIAAAIEDYDAVALAALSVLTTLTGSALLALAVDRQRLEAEAAWAAAHVDEDFQIEAWGTDEEAQVRRAGRWREMEAAARVLRLSRA